ncbi:MAG TPA: M23 family peptidase, partial [Ramlibacter sp.]|nr:M23 family peptidase [Ramlibacter sp.]
MKKNGWIAVGEKLVSSAAHALEHHPKKVTALIAALLLGGGGAAFAVASLDPLPDSVQVRQVLESVQPLPVEDQVNALDLRDINLFRTEITRANDTAESLLSRLGVFDPAAAAYLRKDATF